MAIFVQQSTVGNATATSVALSFSSATAQGNGIVVLIETDGALAEILAPTDNFGNTYTKAAEKTNSSVLSCSVWYTANSGSSISTVTCHFNSSQAFRAVAIEVRDGALFDTSSSAAINSAAPAPGNLTTAVPDEIIFALVNTSGTITATPTGYTTIFERDSPGSDFRYKEVSSITTTNPTWTLFASSPHAVMAVSFRASVVGTANSYGPRPLISPRDRRTPYQFWDKRVVPFPPSPPAPVQGPLLPIPIIAPVMYGMPFLRRPVIVRGVSSPPVLVGPYIPPKAIVLPPLHPVRLAGNGALLGVRPVVAPVDPDTIVQRPKEIPRVPGNINAQHLATSHNNLINLINSLIRSGQLRQSATKEWVIDL